MEMNAAANGLITMLLIFNCGKKKQTDYVGPQRKQFGGAFIE